MKLSQRLKSLVGGIYNFDKSLELLSTYHEYVKDEIKLSSLHC